MDAREKAQRRARYFKAVFLAIFVWYPFSVGPATAVLNITGELPFVSPFDKAIYRPLTKLPKPVFEVLKWWSDRWKESGA